MRLSHLARAALLISALCRAGAPDSESLDLKELSLEQLMNLKVEGAALHPQTLEDAPASVTIITAEEIRKYGYRTLGEALSSVRGFYVSNNRTYQSVGVRGFNLPGDYASHLLVMVNGHNMADDIFDFQLFFGNDFPIDLNLIQRIEIIRGPASALYGSNAIFATLNIITKTPQEAGPLELTSDAGSFGEKKSQVVETTSIGSAQLLLSGSVFNNAGQSPIFFPEFNTPQNNHGNAIGMNGEKGYHLFSTLTWRHWSVTAAFGDHVQIQPISWGATIFNDRGTQVNDHRNFAEAVYARRLTHGDLRWRTYYDGYHFLDRFEYPLAGGAVEDNRQTALGDWIGSQLTYRFSAATAGDITLGAEGTFDLRNLQSDGDVSPMPLQFMRTSHPDRSFAFIIQDEKQLSRRLKLDLGLRVDYSDYRRNFVSPRAALNYQRSSWTYKLLYGRSFRNPSAFQLFYSDGLSGLANPALRPESADTLEFDVERKLGKRMKAQLSAYGYQLNDFMVGVFEQGLIQYQNSGKIRAEGVEFELGGHPFNWLEVTGSFAQQRAYDDNRLENSPASLAKLRFSVPLGRSLDFSNAMQYVSSRWTLGSKIVKSVFLADFTLASKQLSANFDLRAGVRNAFNRSYSDPIALNPIVDTMPQPGRSFFVELTAHRAR